MNWGQIAIIAHALEGVAVYAAVSAAGPNVEIDKKFPVTRGRFPGCSLK